MNNVIIASSIAKGIGRAYCRVPYISFLNNRKTAVKQLQQQRRTRPPFLLPLPARWQSTATSRPVTPRLNSSPASQDDEISDFNLHQSSTDRNADILPSEEARWSNRRSQQNFGHPTSITTSNRSKVDSPVLYQPSSVTRQFGIGNGKEFRHLSTSQIYENLRIDASKGHTKNCELMVNYLVKERGERPNLRIYSSLILSNVNPEGSVAVMMDQIKELRDEGLELDLHACHDVLKVLAVHPDYLLQTEILDYMQARWMELTEDGWHDIVAGLLRSVQFELALDKLDQMQETGMQIQPWLYDMAIYVLTQAGELDEVLRLLKFRSELGDAAVTACMWTFILDKAGELLHYDLISHVWKRKVKDGYLNPSSGICLNVLNAAARKADTDLAIDVFRVLGERNAFLDHQHYEMLIEAYMNAGDLTNALTILYVMQESYVFPDENTIRPIVMYMQQDSARPQQGFEILRTAQKMRKKIPAAAMNACIEGALGHGNLDLAIEFYKTMHVICIHGADTATFNLLLKGCYAAARKDLAMSLAQEMVSMKVRPDSLSYDRILLVCLRVDDYEDAMRYYDEMRGQNFTPRKGTLVTLVKTLAKAGDPRTAKVLDDIEKMGLSTTRLKGWLSVNGMMVPGDDTTDAV
jgi:pentatricopeptide repeat protein